MNQDPSGHFSAADFGHLVSSFVLSAVLPPFAGLNATFLGGAFFPAQGATSGLAMARIHSRSHYASAAKAGAVGSAIPIPGVGQELNIHVTHLQHKFNSASFLASITLNVAMSVLGADDSPIGLDADTNTNSSSHIAEENTPLLDDIELEAVDDNPVLSDGELTPSRIKLPLVKVFSGFSPEDPAYSYRQAIIENSNSYTALVPKEMVPPGVKQAILITAHGSPSQYINVGITESGYTANDAIFHAVSWLENENTKNPGETLMMFDICGFARQCLSDPTRYFEQLGPLAARNPGFMVSELSSVYGGYSDGIVRWRAYLSAPYHEGSQMIEDHSPSAYTTIEGKTDNHTIYPVSVIQSSRRLGGVGFVRRS